MKIIVSSIGTRGDMEPLLAIGQLLKQRGHEVICLFPEQFRSLAEDTGLGFASLGPRFLEMLDSEDGKAALGGSGGGLKKILAYIRLGTRYRGINKELVQKQCEIIEAEKPNRVVHNAKVIYPVIRGTSHPGKNITVTPVPYLHYIKGHTHLAFNSNFGPFFNKMTFAIARFGLVSTIMTAVKWLGLQKQVTREQIKKSLDTGKTIYTISPTLFPRPDYWPDNVQVLGYHERDKTINWQPSESLQTFLRKHKKILFVTFGSMTNPVSEEKTRAFLEVLTRNKIPAIINTAAGGLAEPDNYDRELVHFVAQVPYDWIFPKIYAVVHHGGSGTTHTALKHGCASMIIPHIIDQFVWNKLVADLGAGPKGVRIDKINADRLEPKILELMNNSGYKDRAGEVSRQMATENFEEDLYRAIVE